MVKRKVGAMPIEANAKKTRIANNRSIMTGAVGAAHQHPHCSYHPPQCLHRPAYDMHPYCMSSHGIPPYAVAQNHAQSPKQTPVGGNNSMAVTTVSSTPADMISTVTVLDASSMETASDASSKTPVSGAVASLLSPYSNTPNSNCRRVELDFAQTKKIAEKLSKKPEQKRICLPCQVHPDQERCSCNKVRITIDMYHPCESSPFGLVYKQTGKPLVPKGPEGDAELIKDAAGFLLENPTLMNCTTAIVRTLAFQVEDFLLGHWDIIKPSTRVDAILPLAMLVAQQKQMNKLASTVDEHGVQLNQHETQLNQHETQLGELKLNYDVKFAEFEKRLSFVERRDAPSPAVTPAGNAVTVTPANKTVAAKTPASTAIAVNPSHKASTKLDKNDRLVIKNYTKDFSVNSAMRLGITNDKERMFDGALGLALGKLPDYVGTVYRGANLTADHIKRFQKGGAVQFTDHAYMSTTKTPLESSKLNNFKLMNCWFTIQSKTGKDISKFASGSYKEEEEVLFKPNTSFRVTSVKEDKPNQKTIISMEEI